MGNVVGLIGRDSSPDVGKNNFDLVRLVLAMTVCIAHAYLISGFDSLSWVSEVLSASVAVKAFFVVSGFLVFMSYERSGSMRSYANKRIRRIYPAYVTIVLLSAIILPAIASGARPDYLSSQWIKYVVSNLTFLNFLQPTMPGVFPANIEQTVNGSLWTIKVEVMFYACVPLFVMMFNRFGHFPILVLVYCTSVLYSNYFMGIADATGSEAYRSLGRQLPGQLSYFMTGAFLYYYLSFFKRYIGWFTLAAIILLVIDRSSTFNFLTPFALGVVVIFCAVSFYLGNFGRFGDFSYGVYILHFPIIQLLLHYNVFAGHPHSFLLLAIALTLFGGYLMWHLVEKQFLSKSSHYLAATRG